MAEKAFLERLFGRVKEILERRPPAFTDLNKHHKELGDVAVQAIEHGNEAIVERDKAYEERNRLVAALARFVLAAGGTAGVAKTDIEGWDPEWQNCVYIDAPAGQMSWHFHDREAHLFAGIPLYRGTWDGHSTEEKYARLDDLTVTELRSEYFPRVNYPSGTSGSSGSSSSSGTSAGYVGSSPGGGFTPPTINEDVGVGNPGGTHGDPGTSSVNATSDSAQADPSSSSSSSSIGAPTNDTANAPLTPPPAGASDDQARTTSAPAQVPASESDDADLAQRTE